MALGELAVVSEMRRCSSCGAQYQVEPNIGLTPTDDHCACCGQYLGQATDDGPLTFTLVGECPLPDGSRN